MSSSPNWTALRADFPILDQQVHGKPLIYFDNAATSQKPRVVIEAVSHYYEHDNSNVHRGIHELSNRATTAFEAARTRSAKFINATSAEEIVFTRGTTEGINLVANSWGLKNLKAGDVGRGVAGLEQAGCVADEAGEVFLDGAYFEFDGDGEPGGGIVRAGEETGNHDAGGCGADRGAPDAGCPADRA